MRAFENLFREWKDPVYGYVRRMVGDEALAHDITQDVFLRAMKAAGSYDHRGRLRQWLFTIAANLVVDHARRRKRRREVLIDEPASVDALADEKFAEAAVTGLDSLEIRETVQQAIEKLAPEQRSVLLMRQYADMTFKEIAALEGCSINTTLSRMRYALANLRKILTRGYGEPKKDELRRS